MSEWISVKDRLPISEVDDECLAGFVLAFSQGNSATPAVVCFQLSESLKEIEWIPDNSWFVVTHWMPLPEPPTAEPGKGSGE